MDVRFYPAAAGSALPGDPSNLDFAQCLGYYNYNKVIIPAGVNSSCCSRAGSPRTGVVAPSGRGGSGLGDARSPGRVRPPLSAELGDARSRKVVVGGAGAAGPGAFSCGARPGGPALGPVLGRFGGVRAAESREEPGEAILLPMAGEQRRVPSAQRSRWGRDLPNFPRAAPDASGTARGGLGRPRQERTEPPSALFSRLSPALFLTRGLSKREDYLKVHQLLIQEGK